MQNKLEKETFIQAANFLCLLVYSTKFKKFWQIKSSTNVETDIFNILQKAPRVLKYHSESIPAIQVDLPTINQIL